MSEEIKFEAGDRVRAFGCEGVVVNHDECKFYEVSVAFENGQVLFFNKDGFLNTWHKEPSLVLVEKAKKGVLLHEYLIKIRDAYFTEFHETDEGYKNAGMVNQSSKPAAQ